MQSGWNTEDEYTDEPMEGQLWPHCKVWGAGRGSPVLCFRHTWPSRVSQSVNQLRGIPASDVECTLS